MRNRGVWLLNKSRIIVIQSLGRCASITINLSLHQKSLSRLFESKKAQIRTILLNMSDSICFFILLKINKRNFSLCVAEIFASCAQLQYEMIIILINQETFFSSYYKIILLSNTAKHLLYVTALSYFLIKFPLDYLPNSQFRSFSLFHHHFQCVLNVQELSSLIE